jgi:hypothetical protein
MSLDVVIAAVGGGAAAAAAVGWFLKILIERGLDTKLAAIRKQQELVLIESQRQRSFVWDKQFDVHKTMLSLMYRMKNALMDLAAFIEAEKVSPNQDEMVHRLEAYRSALRELMYEQRALMADDVFPLTHELTSLLHSAGPLLGRMSSQLTGLGPKADGQLDLRELRNLADQVERLYEAATRAIQSRLGLANDA